MNELSCRTGCVIVLVILAIIFPPLVAIIETGCGLDFLINVILTLLGWIPGVIHAWYLIWREPRIIFLRRDPNPPNQKSNKAQAPPPPPNQNSNQIQNTNPNPNMNPYRNNP